MYQGSFYTNILQTFTLAVNKTLAHTLVIIVYTLLISVSGYSYIETFELSLKANFHNNKPLNLLK